MPEYIPSATPESVAGKLSAFTQGYLDAAEFTSRPDDRTEATLWEGATFSLETIAEVIAMCFAFEHAHAADIAEYGERDAGADLWYTRNGHGVGYWEEDHGTPEGCARLDAAAKALGETDLYLGDDGFLYFSRG